MKAGRTSELRDRAPAADAESGNVIEELFIFLGRPEAFAEFRLQATRIASHQKAKKAKGKTEEFGGVQRESGSGF